MRRKLRHLLLFLIIILEELNTPAAGQSWLECSFVSDKPQSISSNASSPISALPLVLIGSMFGVVPGTVLIVTILLTGWYKRRTKRGLNHNAVGTNTNSVMDGGHSKTGQDHSHANNQSLKVGNLSRDEIQSDEVESNTTYVEGPTYANGHNQTGQGQFQVITESNTNTTTAVVTSDHNQTGQGQSQAISESNTNTTTAVVTSDHNQTGQDQSQAITESNTSTTTAVVTSDHIPTEQGQSQAISEFNTSTTTAVVTNSHDQYPIDTHRDQTGQGQPEAITEPLDAENVSDGTGPTASHLNSLYENQHDQTGQGQPEAITQSLDAGNMSYGTGPTASHLNSLYENQ
ncbi:corticospinal neuron axon guidance through spinal cord [Branchiostoma belcheri]|nr:corticospinal neuron axon guidance through spinal cord [Branchiostoma belcheri]